MSGPQLYSEQELVAMLRQGDSSAMGEVYARYAKYLTGVCARYIIEDEDIKDVLQESFIKIFTKADTFRYAGEGSLKAWMAQVTVNEALQHLRNEKRQGLVIFDDERMTDRSDETDEDPDISKLSTDELLNLIRELPPGYRAVFNLYVIEGKRHREIAQLLGIQEATSASQLMRAKRQLAKRIREYITHKQESR